MNSSKTCQDKEEPSSLTVLNISKYQSLEFRIVLITVFIVLVGIPFILAGFSEISDHIIGYLWLFLFFLSLISVALLSTRFYLISLSFWILLICFLYLCLILQKEIWLLLLSTLIIYFLYKSIISLRILLKKWSLRTGIQYNFIDFTYIRNKRKKLKFETKPIKLYLFYLSLFIFYFIGIYLVFIVIYSDIIITVGMVVLISTIALKILYYIRDRERDIIRVSPKVKIDEQKDVIPVLRSHVVDHYELLIKDRRLIGGHSEIEFIVSILEACSLTVACLTLEGKNSKYNVRYAWTNRVDDDKNWLDFIEKNLMKAPLIILILGDIQDPETGNSRGLKEEIELIDQLGCWGKTLLIVPPIQELEKLQTMWDSIKNNTTGIQKPDLKISEKTIGFMFKKNKKNCIPNIELQSDEKDRSSFEYAITIAESILLRNKN